MIVRRFVVAGLTLCLATSLTAGCSSASSDEDSSDDELVQDETLYDAIIVGAGVAGLTAAKDLTKAGRSFLVLEAQNRIGGRALVETKKFSVPIDYGAAWLHGVPTNPLVAIADGLGFRRADTNLSGPIYVGNRPATPEEEQACSKTFEDLEHAMSKAVERGEDPPVSSLLPASAPCADVVGDNVGRYESGAEVNETSAIDSASFEAEDDDFIREGIGTFVAAYGKDVPVRLNAEVTKISWSKPDDLKVTTKSNHTFRARRILTTVSTGVLAAGKIAFEPPLPDWKKEAIAALPMGVLNKVVMEFQSDVFGSVPESSWVLWDGPGANNMAWVIKPLGAPIAVGFYGGAQAREFERSDEAALSNAKEVLRQMFGDQIDAKLKASDITKWASTPWSLGSYSAARPGGSKMHAVMAQPVDDRLFFAGEACGPPRFNGSLAGAYESAKQASALMVKSLGGAKTAN